MDKYGMDKYGYSGPAEFRPLSPWAYFGYSLLFCIPIVGLISLIVLAFNNNNINRRSFARSFFVSALVAVIVALILTLGGVISLNTLSRYY